MWDFEGYLFFCSFIIFSFFCGRIVYFNVNFFGDYFRFFLLVLDFLGWGGVIYRVGERSCFLGFRVYICGLVRVRNEYSWLCVYF